MEIKRLILGTIEVNCYLLLSEKAAIVIDPGFYSYEISEFLNNNIDKERMILLTHSHFDHVGAAKQISDETGVKIGIGKNDAPALSDPNVNLSSVFATAFKEFKPDFNFSDMEEISVGDIKIKVFETPGHTFGSVCYLIDNHLFSGDTIFFESCGRTDFPGGSLNNIKESFYKLISNVNPDVTVYPGHGSYTTIEHEIQCNPLGYFSAL